jgi:Cu-Zn family superoxide dismutase
MQDETSIGRYALPGERVFPESIGYDVATGDFFVGSLADGTIYRGNVGQRQVTVYLPAGAHGCTEAAGIKVDAQRRLWVAGGSTGKLFIHALHGPLLAALEVHGVQTVVNDIAILPDGTAYVTDSANPVLYRVTPDAQGRLVLEDWLPLTGTVIAFHEGLNLNGIGASGDGRYLVVDQTNTGQLYRIEIALRSVAEIDLGGERLTQCDGLLLEGRTLLVVRNALNLLVTVQLAPDLLSGQVAASATQPAFDFPTALARAGDRLLVVSGQLQRMGPGEKPELPFTVAALPYPA